MISNAGQYSAQAIQQNLQQLSSSAAAISNPDGGADLADITALKAAEAAVKINVAVFAKLAETSDRLLDIIV